MSTLESRPESLLPRDCSVLRCSINEVLKSLGSSGKSLDLSGSGEELDSEMRTCVS